MITSESTIGDLLQNPIGRDVLTRLTQYAGLSAAVIDNPIMRSIKLKTLPKLAPRAVDENLIQTLVTLFNQDDNVIMPPASDERPWWKSAVIYQIYPRSFKDSNGDGIGDIAGITEKLDYLYSLGVTALWLSPIFDSPNDDNGYDVRDYKKIMTEFGTMEDIDRLISGLHARGMKLILDLVLNHTSDEHVWFQSSLHDPNGKYGDYYIWRESAGENTPPNNWKSLFSGPAWNYYPERKAWALHLFSKKQMDLNWENPDVREDIFDIARFWRDKGVDGYRLDVINFISKSTLSDGNETLGGMLGMNGVEHYFYGNRLHAFLHAFNRQTVHDMFTVGETPGTGEEMNKLLTAPSREELSTVFCFDHIDGHGKMRFDDYRYDLNHLKQCFLRYEGEYADYSWPTIFVENHDNPRMPSKIDTRMEYRDRIAKLLAILLLTARGTVFLYQGQEIGAVNVDFQGISEIRDVESINLYNEKIASGVSEAEAWRTILCGTRDHARTPMQWTDAEFGGFSNAAPWMRLGDKDSTNVRAQENDPHSVLNFYRKLIALRNMHDTFVFGKFAPMYAGRKNVFCYIRSDENEQYYIEANLCDHAIARPNRPESAAWICGNYADGSEKLRAYEANVYRLDSLPV